MKSGAKVIVTANLKDFSVLPQGIEARSPDDFLCDLFYREPRRFVTMLRVQAADLHKPRISFEELLDWLGRPAPRLVATVKEYLSLSQHET